MNNTIILIADTEEAAASEKELLVGCGTDILTASSEAALSELIVQKRPDLLAVSLDIISPERLKLLCEMAQLSPGVIFLSEDGSREKECFEAGALDLITKPFEPTVFTARVSRAAERIALLKERGKDPLTGLPDRDHTITTLMPVCAEQSGVLMVIDLDNFGLVSDVYGKEIGSKVLKYFGEKLSESVTGGEFVGRIGADSFVVCSRIRKNVHSVNAMTVAVNGILSRALDELADGDVEQLAGASIGAVYFPEEGKNAAELIAKAENALTDIRQYGKRGYAVLGGSGSPMKSRDNLDSLEKAIRERGGSTGAYRIKMDELGQVYPYFMRYIDRYCDSAFKVLFTLVPTRRSFGPVYEIAEYFGELIARQLRRSDILVHTQQDQFFLILPDVTRENFELLMSRILKPWYASEYSEVISLSYETKQIVDKPKK